MSGGGLTSQKHRMWEEGLRDHLGTLRMGVEVRSATVKFERNHFYFRDLNMIT